MFVEWNDYVLAAFELQPEKSQSVRGETRTKLPPCSWEWSIELITFWCIDVNLTASVTELVLLLY